MAVEGNKKKDEEFIEHVYDHLLENDDIEENDIHITVSAYSFINPKIGVHYIRQILILMRKLYLILNTTLYESLRYCGLNSPFNSP